MRLQTPKKEAGPNSTDQRKDRLAARKNTLASVQVPAAKAKAHLLGMLSEVDRAGHEFVITKRGKPVAKLVPVLPAEDIVGCMKGTFRITGDVVGPEADDWEAFK